MPVQLFFNQSFAAIMALEIFAIEVIYAFQEEKHQHFGLRVGFSVVLLLAVTMWVQCIYTIATHRNFEYTVSISLGDSAFKFLYYCFIFACTIGCIKLCFKIPITIALFYGAAGYATQHAVVNGVSLLGIYFTPIAQGNARMLCEFLFCAIVYCIAGWSFMRKHYVAHTNAIGRKVFLGIAVLLMCIGVSRFVNETQITNRSTRLAIHLYAIGSCVLILEVFYGINENDVLKNKTVIFEEILEHDKRQYELLRSSIETINIKCHDMKHQLAAIRAGGGVAQDIAQAVNDYDDFIETGSEVLNVLMTDKNIQCKKEGITFSCMMDGTSMSFLNELDMYSLLGNALSNAIEAAGQVTDSDRRCVSVNSIVQSGMLLIHVENGYAGTLQFVDGIPQTSRDRVYHGYGMMSMQRTVEKYDGAISANADEDKFYLDLILPIPTQSGEEDAKKAKSN